MYHLQSIKVDENGIIHIGKRTEDSSCSNRFGHVTLDDNLSFITNQNTFGNGNCGSALSRIVVNGIEVTSESWGYSPYQRGKAYEIGNYSLTFTNSPPYSNAPDSCDWDNIVVHNESLAFVRCGTNLKAVNPDTGSELWSVSVGMGLDVLQYFPFEDALVTTDGTYHGSNGSRNDSLVNFNISFLTNYPDSGFTPRLSTHPDSKYYLYTSYWAYDDYPFILADKLTGNESYFFNGTLFGPFDNGVSYILMEPLGGNVSVVTFDRDNDGYLDYPFADPGDSCEHTLNYTSDNDMDGCDDLTEDLDDDNDGFNDTNDSFPFDPNEWNDTDADGVGDNADPDDDGDGYNDTDDTFPLDPNEWNDTDADGVGDNSDAFPSDPGEWNDTDSDGVGDNSDAFPSDSGEWNDTDSDGVGDNSDAFPSDSGEWNDTDSDGVGDNSDSFPLDPNEWDDTDSDGVGDNSDVDDDGDGWSDADEISCGTDPFLWTSTPLDTDNDQICDIVDIDDDNDGFDDSIDPWPFEPCAGQDTDGDGMPDLVIITMPRFSIRWR